MVSYTFTGCIFWGIIRYFVQQIKRWFSSVDLNSRDLDFGDVSGNPHPCQPSPRGRPFVHKILVCPVRRRPKIPVVSRNHYIIKLQRLYMFVLFTPSCFTGNSHIIHTLIGQSYQRRLFPGIFTIIRVENDHYYCTVDRLCQGIHEVQETTLVQ